MKRQLIFGHLLTLLIGGLIYILFRVDSLRMFEWINIIQLDTPVKLLRESTTDIKALLPNWFVFSLPDGLLVFSYISLTLLIWKNKVSRKNIFWICIMPVIAIIVEMGQLYSIMPGTFDLIDLCFYTMGVFIPLMIFSNSLTNNRRTI